jgi:hypothetical protein
MIISLYLQRIFLYRFLAVFGISFCMAMFLELTTFVTQPNVSNNIAKFIYYTFCKGIIFTDSAIFFVTMISTIIFASHISNTRQLEIILLYHGNPMLILRKIASVIFGISFFYIFIFHGFFYYKITNFMNTYKTTYIVKENVEKVWLSNIDITNQTNIKGDVFLLKNAKIYQNGFIVENIFHYKIENSTLAKYTKYSKTFITNTPTKEMVFFSLDKDSHIARNAMEKVKLEDIYTSFVQSGKKSINQNTYSEIKKIFTPPTQISHIQASRMYLLNILQLCLSFFAGCILVLSYLLNVTGRNITYSFTTIKVLSYGVIFYATTEIIKIIYPHTSINYVVSLMLTITAILIFTSKFIKKYC